MLYIYIFLLRLLRYSRNNWMILKNKILHEHNRLLARTNCNFQRLTDIKICVPLVCFLVGWCLSFILRLS